MSIGSVGSTSSIMKFQDFVTTAVPHPSVDTLVSRLESSITSGNLDSSQSILEAIKSLAPADLGKSDPLGNLLSAVRTAVKDHSTAEAETTLTTYQAALAGPNRQTRSIQGSCPRRKINWRRTS